jgi:hypothetical protein
MSSLPLMASSTMPGNSVRPFTPPKALPRHTLPVTSWKGRVLISAPASATPTDQQSKRAAKKKKRGEHERREKML